MTADDYIRVIDHVWYLAAMTFFAWSLGRGLVAVVEHVMDERQMRRVLRKAMREYERDSATRRD